MVDNRTTKVENFNTSKPKRLIMRGLSKKSTSNRDLAKRLQQLKRISFCNFDIETVFKISTLDVLGKDTHTFFPTENSFIYRALINESETPYTSINWIRFNPSPKYMSRANLKNKGVAYYSNAADVSMIESCADKLRNSKEREFELTVSKWKILKKLSFQIICNSQDAQSAGTDLSTFCVATNRKRRSDMLRKDYRTYFLKAQFLAEQYAKDDISCDNDYCLSAIHANSILKPENEIDGIIYPSVQYFYRGFNYAFAPRLFDYSYFRIVEVAHIKIVFDKRNIYKYPKWDVIDSTTQFIEDEIIW